MKEVKIQRQDDFTHIKIALPTIYEAVSSVNITGGTGKT